MDEFDTRSNYMCEHSWSRTNGATTDDGYDLFRCLRCGATGKSFGISGVIIEDSTLKQGGKRRRRYFSQTSQYRKQREHRDKWKSSDGLQWSRAEYEKRISVKQSDSSDSKSS